MNPKEEIEYNSNNNNNNMAVVSNHQWRSYHLTIAKMRNDGVAGS